MLATMLVNVPSLLENEYESVARGRGRELIAVCHKATAVAKNVARAPKQVPIAEI